MLERLTPARRNAALLAVAALVLFFAWKVRVALNPLLLALLFAYMLHPLVLRLERRGWSRKLAVNVIFGGAAAALVLVGCGVWIQARGLARDVAERGVLERIDREVQEGWAKLRTELEELGLIEPVPPQPEPVEQVPSAVAPEEQVGLSALVREITGWLQSDAGRGAGQAGVVAAGGLFAWMRRLFGSLLSFLALLLLVPIYTWFLLFELERIAGFLRGYVPIQHRDRVGRIGDQIAEMLGKFFHGRLLVCLLKGLLLAATLAVLGVPYAFLLGMLSGALSLIPIVGPGVGYAAAFLLSMLAHEPLGALWRVGVAFAVGEVIEGYVLLPQVLGESLGLHPVVVIVSLTVFGSALGMFGLILAVPLTATLVILFRELVLPALRQWAEATRTARRSAST